MPKDKGPKSGSAGGGVRWRDWSLYWGLKQAGAGSKELVSQRKRWLSNREERGIEGLGVCRPGRLGKKDTRNRGSQRRWSRGRETDRLSNGRWEVWGRGEEESRREGGCRGEIGVWGDGMQPEQRGLGDHCAANWRWNAGGGGVCVSGGGSWIVELSAVLNLERRLRGAVLAAGFGAARGTRARALPLILNVGELYAQLNPEASYPGA